MASVILGTDVETGDAVRIGDIERRSGLYLLGRTGMGKSALAVNIALYDIAHGHGLFFLDPHGDAVNDLLRRGDARELKQKAHLFDIEDDDYSFGINLLTCDNVKSLRSRNTAYARAYNVFFKIWEEQWGVWLQLILENVLWAFIENPGYSLADVPMFLNPRNEDFRNHIISNIHYNTPVADFWRYEFFSRREQTQQERVDAALTRLNSLLNHPYVRDIVGQAKTTIDFANVLSTNKVILLKLSANLPEDVKKFVGTILLNELVHAVRDRPEDKRIQFCIFVDEFHNFASSDYMATMVTEGRKFGVASTFLHVERFGQLVNNQKLMGATQAIVNKVFFQTTVNDAEELAPEVASQPPIEKRYEQQFIISQNPVADLMRGHTHPVIRSFTEKYLKLIHRRMEDIKTQLQVLRNSPKWRLGEESVQSRKGISAGKIYNPDIFAVWAISMDYHFLPLVSDSEEEVIKGRDTSLIYKEYVALENILSLLDKFFIASMENRMDIEEFIQTMHQVIAYLCPYPFPYQLLQLYISCVYDNKENPRPIPVEFAIKYWPELVEKGFVEQNQELLQSAYERSENRYQYLLRDIHCSSPTPPPPYQEYVEEKMGKELEELRAGKRYKKRNDVIEVSGNYYHTYYKGEMKRSKYIMPEIVVRVEDQESVKYLCLEYLANDILVNSSVPIILTFLNDLMEVCIHLSTPEGIIQTTSPLYTERETNERTYRDMTDETVQELTRLPRYQAYSKIIDEIEDRQIVRTHRIQTHPLPEIQSMETELQAIASGHTLGKKRIEIEAEIRERQKRWLPGSDKPTTRGR